MNAYDGVAAQPSDPALASLFGTQLGYRYCAWVGASGRRYIVSVYPVDDLFADAGLPEFDGFVLMPVAYDGPPGRGPGRKVLAATAVERNSDRQAVIAEALRQGAREWHVHLLAAAPEERRVAAADLAARYGLKGPFSA